MSEADKTELSPLYHTFSNHLTLLSDQIRLSSGATAHGEKQRVFCTLKPRDARNEQETFHSLVSPPR